MDGVSWSAHKSQESFNHSAPRADTLSRLASFIARADIKQHARSQRDSLSHTPKFVCQECDQSFPLISNLLQHQELKHSLPKPHRCPSCGQGFSLKSSLQLHGCSTVPHPSPHWSTGRLHTSGLGRTQGKSLLCQPNVLDHSPYACVPCGRGFSLKQALLHHQQAGCSEPLSLSDIIKARGLPEDYPLLSKGNTVHPTCSDTPGPSTMAINACQVCSQTFHTEAGLQHHQQSSHIDEQGSQLKGEQLTEENEAYKCPPKMSSSKAKFLSCRSCDMIFRSTAKLYVHRKEKHSREKPLERESRPVVVKRRRGGVYPCQVCSKVFVHHLSLRAHYRQHTTVSFTSINHECPAEERRTKEPNLSVNLVDAVKPNQGENIGVQSGTRRPRKYSRAEDKLDLPRSCRDATKVAKPEEAEKEFPCPSCPEIFPLLWQLNEHVEVHQSALRRKQCSVCTTKMDNCGWPRSRRQRLYHCIPCQQGFSVLDSFLEHCQEHLRIRVEEDRVAESCTQPAGTA